MSLDIEELGSSRADDRIIKNSTYIFEEKGRFLVSGEEQQGKTTLLKSAFRFFAAKGIPVVYLNASSITGSDLNKLIGKAISSQYEGLTIDDILSAQDRVLLLDNLHEIGLNEKFRGTFLEAVTAAFDHIIVTCSSSFMYSVPDVTTLDDYRKFELMGMGHVKRAEIVEKWVALGIEESICEKDLYNQCDEIKAKLDAIIRKNIVPAKPIYVLMLLQMLEAYSQQSLDLSSYGHCYQQLVYQAFDNAKIPKREFDTYLNVLTELSWDIHTSGEGINSAGLDTFFKNYQETFLSVDGEAIITKLEANSILQTRDHRIHFKYPYLYYFFVAKRIAESYSTSEQTRESVKTLIDNLHREDYANILVFVTHHTREKWVLDEINTALGSLFSQHEPSTLSKDEVAFMQEFIAKIPELVIEQREIRAERQKRNEELDEIERFDEEPGPLSLSEESKKVLSHELPALVNKTFKGMELSGQIIRNRHATLPRVKLLELAQEGAFCGLRFLTFFIDISDAAKSEVIKYVANSLKSNPELTNAEIQEHATNQFLVLTYGVINNVLRKIASSIGSKEASEIYAQLQIQEQSPAVILLEQAISLQFTRKLDIAKLSDTYSKIKSNPVCVRILKDMAVQHVYMFPVGYKEKQQLSSLLHIPVQSQRIMDRKKSTKG